MGKNETDEDICDSISITVTESLYGFFFRLCLYTCNLAISLFLPVSFPMDSKREFSISNAYEHEKSNHDNSRTMNEIRIRPVHYAGINLSATNLGFEYPITLAARDISAPRGTEKNKWI